MARGRAYLRVLPESFGRKAFAVRDDEGRLIRESYPPAAVAAFYGMLCLAEGQPERGRFASLRVLRALLEGPDGCGQTYSRQVAWLVKHRDLIVQPNGSVYVDGWDELQEGDLDVPTRMRRYRGRSNTVTPEVTATVTPTVTASVTAPTVADPSNVVVDTRIVGTSGELRAESGGRLTGGRNDAAPAHAGTWFDGDDPEHAALVWLSQHNATLEPNGRGLHLRLIRLVKTRGLDAVLAAFEELARDPDVTEANQFVLGADNRLVRIPRAPGPVEEPWERDLRETRERIEAKREAARQAGQAGQTP